MTEKIILLVDDEERLLNSIAKRISLQGFTPLKALSGAEAIGIVEKTHVDLAIVDLKMPDMDGLVTITKLKEIAPDLKTILLTGYGSEKTKQATEALGSIYIEKDSMAELWEVIKNSSSDGKVVVINPPSASADSKGRGNSRVEIMTPEQYTDQGSKKPSGSVPNIVGHTAAIQRLKKNVTRFAEMDCAIALKGESGTGRELVARTIHALSARKYQRFLAFDCGCFSDDFNFSQLVHSFEGSYSYGLQKNRTFSGTVLLDNIENMPTRTQQEMIDLLDGVWNASDSLMDIRFIVVSGQRARKTSGQGDFQKELLSRIHAIELAVPPLRERRGDIPVLIQYFLNQANEEFGKRVKTLSEESWQAIASYSFPGNVRELKHMIERAVILSGGDEIQLEQLPDAIKSGGAVEEVKDNLPFPSIHEMEKEHILKALKMTKGNKSKASDLLGISRAALWRKLRLIEDNK